MDGCFPCKEVIVFSLLILILVLSPAVQATDTNCYLDAGTSYDIDPLLLYSIAEVESNHDPDAVNNSNGLAIGLMQIHDWWFPLLQTYHISTSDLFDPCQNLMVGAWILKQQISIFGNTWNSVGAYYAGTGKSDKIQRLRSNYAAKVFSVYKKYQRKQTFK